MPSASSSISSLYLKPGSGPWSPCPRSSLTMNKWRQLALNRNGLKRNGLMCTCSKKALICLRDRCPTNSISSTSNRYKKLGGICRTSVLTLRVPNFFCNPIEMRVAKGTVHMGAATILFNHDFACGTFHNETFIHFFLNQSLGFDIHLILCQSGSILFTRDGMMNGFAF